VVSRIFIVGSGVVGSATGRGFVQAGHDVTFVDISAERIDALTAEGFDARDRLDLRGEPESFVFLTLPTPNVGHEYDLTAFRAGARDVAVALREADAVHTVVVRSTVPPGTTERLVKPILEDVSGASEGVGFTLAANPEFLRAASANDDFRWPWMTVIGARSKRVAERLQALLEPFGGQLRLFDKPETAEFVKCAHNIYNASKISFWNEMWLVCQELGLDHDEVATTVADSAEASTNRLYGIRGGAPYGGVCLPKDTQGFLGFARDIGVRMPLLEAVVEVNDMLAARVATEIEALSHGNVPAGTRIRAGERQTVVDLRPRPPSTTRCADRRNLRPAAGPPSTLLRRRPAAAPSGAASSTASSTAPAQPQQQPQHSPSTAR
jgi:UDPglucose 6-dehydrogenase